MPDMIQIRIDTEKLTAALKRLSAAGRNLSPAMRAAAGIMADAVEENFEQEGRPKWKSLAGSTLRQRAKEGHTGKVLQRRGNLARSITRHTEDAWSWSMWRGYLGTAQGAPVREWFDKAGTPSAHLHTSGHASPADLREFAQRMNPKALVPVHGTAWRTEMEGFPRITKLADGQSFAV